MYGLDDAHGGAARPIQAAWCGEFEGDREVAQFDRANTGIRMNDDMGWNSIGKAELVCCGYTVHQNSSLVAPCYGVDDRCVIGGGGFCGKAVNGGYVIESAINAPNVVGLGQSLEGLVDTGAGAQVEEVHRCPREEWLSSAHPVEDLGLQIQRRAAMRLDLSEFCIHIEDNICPNNVNTFRTDLPWENNWQNP